MGLSLLDIKTGTIVDHTWERKDGKTKARPIIRRGIIVGVEGAKDAIEGVWVKFKPEAEQEKIDAFELVRVHPAGSRIAQERYREVMKLPNVVGEELRPAKIRPRLVDELSLSPGKRNNGLVEPEYQPSGEQIEPLITGEPTTK